jgi:YD repeat-containing protein
MIISRPNSNTGEPQNEVSDKRTGRIAITNNLVTVRKSMTAPKTLWRALFVAAISFWSPAADCGIISYTYDPAGRLVAADYGTSKTISYAYDNAGNLLRSSQPTPGLTVVSLVGNQLTLSWPASPSGFVLESASSIGPGAQWTNPGVQTTQSGNLTLATVTLSGTTFYRLHK